MQQTYLRMEDVVVVVVVVVVDDDGDRTLISYRLFEFDSVFVHGTFVS